jgi:hypothetical protein
MNAFLSAIGKSLLMGAAVIVWIVLIPLLDCLRNRSGQENGPSARPFGDVSPQARSLRQAA